MITRWYVGVSNSAASSLSFTIFAILCGRIRSIYEKGEYLMSVVKDACHWLFDILCGQSPVQERLTMASLYSAAAWGLYAPSCRR